MFIARDKAWMNWKENVCFIASEVLYMLSWYSIRFQKNKILPLLQKVESVSKPFEALKIDILVGIVFCSYFVFFPLVLTTASDKEFRMTYTLYFMYGFDYGSDAFKDVYVFVKLISMMSFIPFCIFTVLMLYLVISFYLSLSLEEFKRAIVISSSQEFVNSLPTLTKKYDRILNVLREFQDTFSLTSFFLCLGHIAVSFTTISFLLLFPNFVDAMVLFERLYVFLTSTISIISLFYIGGQIPVKMAGIRATFYAKMVAITPGMLDAESQARLDILNKLVDLPEIILSGSDIIFYTKTNIFGTLGSFVTYSLLLLQFKHEDIPNGNDERAN
ncbi:hypothetical protein TNCT_219371 [Trichonephila clavata]|uniref:Gustatory receptor n=1 Tax=Trichonephila clavata TaxID=2740835 RepID=A0A8X6F8G9_TRICU|nr:hypothetical protein TNCT_219371 [Trichonephila clavata]